MNGYDMVFVDLEMMLNNVLVDYDVNVVWIINLIFVMFEVEKIWNKIVNFMCYFFYYMWFMSFLNMGSFVVQIFIRLLQNIKVDIDVFFVQIEFEFYKVYGMFWNVFESI